MVMLLLVFSSSAWADSSATATGSAETKVQINQDLSDNSRSDSQDKRPHVLAVPGTAGMFPFPSGAGSMGQWQPLVNQPLLKVFDQKILNETYVKNMKIWDHLIRKNYLQETIYEKNSVPVNKEPIFRLDWVPQGDIFYPGDRLLAEIEIIGSHEWTSTASLLLGLRRAKEVTNTRRVVIWVRYKTEAFNKGRSLGTGAGGGLMVGPHGAVDDKAVAIALGGLWGTTWGGLWHSVDVRIWCLNDGPVDPPPALLARFKKEEAPILPKPEAAVKPEVAPKAELVKPEVTPEKEKVVTPSKCDKCEEELAKEKLAAEEFAKKAMKEAEKAKKAEQLAVSRVEKIQPCPATLHFPINEYLPTLDTGNIQEAKKMVKWLLDNSEKIKRQGGQFVMIGGCDERLIQALKQPDKKYTAALKSLVGPNQAYASYHPSPTDKDYVNPVLGERRSRMGVVYLAQAADEMGVLSQVDGIIRSIKKVSSGKDWLVVADKPLDEKNRYAILAVVIGGPGATAK